MILGSGRCYSRERLKCNGIWVGVLEPCPFLDIGDLAEWYSDELSQAHPDEPHRREDCSLSARMRRHLQIAKSPCCASSSHSSPAYSISRANLRPITYGKPVLFARCRLSRKFLAVLSVTKAAKPQIASPRTPTILAVLVIEDANTDCPIPNNVHNYVC